MEEKKQGFFTTLKRKIRDKLGIKTRIIKVPAPETKREEPSKTYMKTPLGRMEIRPDGTIVLFHGSLTPEQRDMNEKAKDFNEEVRSEAKHGSGRKTRRVSRRRRRRTGKKF